MSNGISKIEMIVETPLRELDSCILRVECSPSMNPDQLLDILQKCGCSTVVLGSDGLRPVKLDAQTSRFAYCFSDNKSWNVLKNALRKQVKELMGGYEDRTVAVVRSDYTSVPVPVPVMVQAPKKPWE
jgi:hypothetical protein